MDVDGDVDGFESMIELIDSYNLNRDEKAMIVEAGAVLASKTLEEKTKEKENPELDKIVMNFKKSKGGYYEYDGHLSQGVTHKPNQHIDGGTDLGFKKGYVTVAHWLNDGTYRQPATYFLDKAFKDIQEDDKVIDAQKAMAMKIIDTKANN